jgi:hypothetical protein
MVTARACWLALSWMLAACQPHSEELPAPFPVLPVPPALAAEAPRQPEPPSKLTKQYAAAVGDSFSVAASSTSTLQLTELRKLNRRAQVAMAILQKTPAGPRYGRALTEARDAVTKLSAYLTEAAKEDRP